MDKSIELLLKTARMVDVHRWSDYPEVNEVINDLLTEISQLRTKKKIQVRGKSKVWRHIKVVVLDLFIASETGLNPYVGLARRKADYQRKSRYRKLHLKYDYLISVVDDLIELGYIEQHKGFKDRTSGKGYRSRIKATDKLLKKFYSSKYRLDELITQHGIVELLSRTAGEETIIVHDKDKNQIEYEDTPETIRMREALALINTKISNTHITLEMTDAESADLQRRLRSRDKSDRLSIDFSCTTLCRIFNDLFFETGGRFYGGWWEILPKEYRKYIQINRKATVEIDYSGHHIRMLYAQKNILVPEDLYKIENCPFTRQQIKDAILVIINASDRDEALNALRRRKKIRNAAQLLRLIETHFFPIADQFYTGVGLKLQYRDSVIAERVMLRMQKLGATVLPLHDSFIVRNSYEQELREVMEEEFQREFGSAAALSMKESVLDRAPELIEGDEDEFKFVTMDLEELLKDYVEDRKWSRKMFGM